MSLIEKFKNLNKVCQKPRYKEAGNWMVRNIIREACVPMTYFLLKTPITANQVTSFALFLGVVGCFLFIFIHNIPFLWLAIFLQLSYYFDHVDGQIARCKKQVSLSGAMLDFISHYIIYVMIMLAIGLKGYHQTNNPFFIYCGIIAAISILAFNLLSDSKYRAFFIKQINFGVLRINKETRENKNIRTNLLSFVFTTIYKTCEMHIIINTMTIIAIMQLFKMQGINGIVWSNILAVYYAVACFFIAILKIPYVIITRKIDNEFSKIFIVDNKYN